ncbi:acyltransferase [Mediterraneibacter massiliensis]|uniref:acyltransferase n=1 Tax=Mediterraneibacter massiliensis TaxID=1720300 RepID=UPI000E4D98E6|nr:acyltransferase family protein [Mediterraneibacter massiliensis]RGT70923.1 acyltransferase [Ruminococcus sp. AF18-22]
MQGKQRIKKRDYNLEIVRIFSFFSVIAIHVTNYFCRAYDEISAGEYGFSLALNTVARVSVPCFFMITGALLLGREETLEKHIKRLMRFAIVLVVWSILYYVWNTIYMKTPYRLRDILYVPTEPHLWYLYAMIPIYMVLPFLQIMCRFMGMKLEYAFLVLISITTVFNYISSLLHEEAYYDLPLVGDKVYMFYVFIGYYIYRYRKHIQISQKAAFLLFVGNMAAIYGITVWVTVNAGEHYERILEYGCPFLVAGSAAFFLWMIRFRRCHFEPAEKSKKRIEKICSCSFGIYLVHILFLDTYKKYIEPADLTAWAAVPLLICGIAAVSYVCIFLLRKCAWGRKIT